MTDMRSDVDSAMKALSNLMGVPESETPDGALVAQPRTENTPLAVSHVASASWRYPGEPLTFYTRLDVLQAVPGFAVQISLPPELPPEVYSASANHEGNTPEVVVTEDGRYIVWRLGRAAEVGERFEYEVETVAPHTTDDLYLESTALVLLNPGTDEPSVAETVEVKIQAKGSYLKYLPALYYNDELMGRFLMLFESFFAPIERHIDNIWYYFDPKMTPRDFLPWLATWTDLELDERWTDPQQRKLLESAARLYRMRGTKQGLVDFLEIYTGRKAVIAEHRANNLRLGKEAHFGASVAIGRSNKPHSFSVTLRLPPVTLREGEDETVRQRKDQDRRRMIQSIIEAEKPAHTTYTLFIQEDN